MSRLRALQYTSIIHHLEQVVKSWLQSLSHPMGPALSDLRRKESPVCESRSKFERPKTIGYDMTTIINDYVYQVTLESMSHASETAENV